MYKKRLENVRNIIKEQDADAFFVSNASNIYWLSGFAGIAPHERECTMLITLEHAHLYIPAMYAQQAMQTASCQESTVSCVIDQERDGLMTLFAKRNPEIKKVLCEASNITIAEREHIEKECGLSLIPINGKIEQLRINKDAHEIDLIKKAVFITDQVFNSVLDLLQKNDYTQYTEYDISEYIKRMGRKLGSNGIGFEPIVALGPHSALPHYFTADTQLQKNNALLLDFGISYKGYTGDLTRMIYLGEAPQKYKDTYAIVLEANEAGISATKAGTSAGDAYATSFAVLQKYNVEKYFLHGLGHGVGIDIHEQPTLRKDNATILQENMAVTIEPGVYFEGEFGIRIEDFGIITKEGIEIISNNSDKKLIEIR